MATTTVETAVCAILLCSSAFIISFATAETTASSPSLPPDALPTQSGYLPISSKSKSALYYAFYEAQNATSPPSQTPLLIWLQGGPGCSSMIANFYELGPYLVDTLSPQPSLKPNPNSWNHRFGLLFIDNPIGTGFSVASSPDEIPRNQTVVAEHLWFGLQSLFSSNPALRTRPLFFTGESYAGKYIPAAAYYILSKNGHVAPSARINLQGVAIGDGLTHPVTQVATHAVSAFYTGLINQKQMRELEAIQAEAVRLTEAAQWEAATDARNKVLRWLQNATGLATLYDLRRDKPYETEKVSAFLNHDGVKAAMKARQGIKFEECSDLVGGILHADVMKSVKDLLEGLLRANLRVLLYQGQSDLRDGVVSTEAWLMEVEWAGLGDFLEANREVWNVDGKLAGYVQRSGCLTHAVVLGAGHLVPTDQGRNSQEMIEDWVGGRGQFGDSGRRALRRSYL